jgi:small-conductance mechanosensitive channel/predicted  nucleic acid-binding Zn-ribbon protein
MNPVLVLSLLFCGPSLLGQQPAPSVPVSKQDAPLSDAERIVKLQQLIAQDQKDLKGLNAELNEPDGEYAKASAQFQALDAQRTATQKKMAELNKAGKTEEATKLGKESESLEKDWLVARERFNLAIHERRLLQEKIANLEQEVGRLQGRLRQILDGTPANNNATAAASQPAAKPAASPPPTSSTPASPAAATNSTDSSKPTSRRLSQAEDEAKALEADAAQARSQLQLLTEHLEGVRKSADLEEKLLETARKQANQAETEYTSLTHELAEKKAQLAPAELLALSKKIADAKARLEDAQGDVATSTERLRELRSRVAAIQSKQEAAQKEVNDKQAAAQKAQRRVAQLANPFSLPNLLTWVEQHAPRVLLVLAGMFLFLRLVNALGRRIVRFMVQHGHRGSPEENEKRAETLVSVFHNAASLSILGGGCLMLLQELGVPIMPLLGGAAVLGLAVAFGAQNLIRDYFSGFMVLMEDQYGINDVVKINGVSGTVEKITLRVTLLRDMAGVVHFIPHGTISTVSNLTHGWSQALFDIPVSSVEDVDRAMTVLIEVGRELRRDPAYAPVTLDGPEMLGVDDLTDGKVMLRFFIKTRPLKQWLVKREMLRRIKHRFDELGIASPFSPRPIKEKAETPASMAA